jgi:predicted DNA-binding protein
MMTHTFPVTEQDERAESFHLRLPAELIRKIEELARQEHRTKANMLRLLLIESLEERERRRTS